MNNKLRFIIITILAIGLSPIIFFSAWLTGTTKSMIRDYIEFYEETFNA